MPILCHHSRVNHGARGCCRVLCNRHVISYDRSGTGAASQTSGHGLVHSPRVSVFLYFADALHKAACNAPLPIRSTWEIEHHGNKREQPTQINKPIATSKYQRMRGAVAGPGRHTAVRIPPMATGVTRPPPGQETHTPRPCTCAHAHTQTSPQFTMLAHS